MTSVFNDDSIKTQSPLEIHLRRLGKYYTYQSCEKLLATVGTRLFSSHTSPIMLFITYLTCFVQYNEYKAAVKKTLLVFSVTLWLCRALYFGTESSVLAKANVRSGS